VAESAADIYRAALAGGFDPASAAIATQIALAESGGRVDELGDVGLEDRTWGPSYGLWQVRTLKAQTGSGSARDISTLAAGDVAQARAAYQISAGGTDFRPWTAYRTGAFARFASTVAGVAGGTAAPAGMAPIAGTPAPAPFPTWGPAWLPWNLPSDIGNAAAGAAGGLLSGVRGIVIEAGAGALGLALLVMGAVRIAKPHVKARAEQAAAIAGKVL